MSRDLMWAAGCGLAALSFAGACSSPSGVAEEPAAVPPQTVIIGGHEYDTVPPGLDPRSVPPPSFARLDDYFPNPRLLTHEGKEVRFYDDLVEGKIVMFNFMYTTCNGI